MEYAKQELSTKLIFTPRNKQLRMRECFRILKHPEALKANYKPFKIKDYDDLEYIAHKLYREAAYSLHPDMHHDNKDFYTQKFTELNEAYHQALKLIRQRKRENYADAMYYL